MPKTYSNAEVMAMLEKNPKLEFQYCDDEDFTVYADKDGEITILEGEVVTDFAFHINDKWTLVSHPVGIKEAMKASCKGKIIECHIDNRIFTYDNPLGLTDTSDGPITANEILRGVWYIREE